MRMKRRDFLGASVGTAAALSVIGGCNTPRLHSPAVHSGRGLSVLDSEGRLGGKTLEELRDQYRYDLFDEYIPFHDRWVVDHTYGGFTLKTGWNGPTLSYEKTSTYEGRGIWTYSFLYNKIDPNPQHLEAARGSVEFIMKPKPSGDTLWPSTYTREGRVINGPPTAIYGDIFR